MHLAEAVKIALQSLWANKLRSVLTLLGVVIGVAAVIAVVTFINGINRYVAEKVFNLGADVFIITKVSPVITDPEQFLEGMKRKDLTLDDFEAVQEACTRCSAVAASIRNEGGKIVYGENSSTDTTVQGITPDYLAIRDLDLTVGRPLNDADLRSSSHVALVGPDLVDHLMPGIDPMGRMLRVDGTEYLIVGVGKARGKTLGQSLDNYVMIPITTSMAQYGSHHSIAIVAKANAVGTELEQAIDQTRVILRARRHDAPGKPDTFEAQTNANFLALWASLSGVLFIVAIIIPSISLVVGGIVIMNIMLVSVTERTREIGIRKALGAKRVDVLRQFLIEAAVLSLIGGLMGVLGGIVVALAVTQLIGLPSSIELWAVGAGMFVATSVGVFFGAYPAWQAAGLDPITALRFEM